MAQRSKSRQGITLEGVVGVLINRRVVVFQAGETPYKMVKKHPKKVKELYVLS